MAVKYKINGVNTDVTDLIYNNEAVNQLIFNGETAWRRPFTVSFTNPTYGAWENSSLTAYYGDSITISTNTVTCKNADDNTTRWTNTCIKKENDSTYSYTVPTITPSSDFIISEAIIFSATDSRDYIPYTITWKYLSAYPDTWATTTETYHYNDTPSRATPSTVTNSGSTERKVPNTASYTNGWNSLAKVTASRTITCQYIQQYYVKISAINSTAHKGSATDTAITSGSSAWYDSNQTITWTPATNYSFSEGTSQTNTTATISSTTALSKSPGYGYVTVSKTRCSGIATGYRALGGTTFTANSHCAYSADGTVKTDTSQTVTAGGSLSSNARYIEVTVQEGTMASANKSSGWHEYNTKCTWSRTNSSYAFNASGAASVDDYFTNPGGTYNHGCTHGYYSTGGSHRSVYSGDSAGWYDLLVSKTFSTNYMADDGWSFGGSSNRDIVNRAITAFPPTSTSATPAYCRLTFNNTNEGSWDATTKWAKPNDTVSFNESTLTATCKEGSTTRWTNKFNLGTPASGYEYGADGIPSPFNTSNPFTVSGPTTITITTKRLKIYSLTIETPASGSLGTISVTRTPGSGSKAPAAQTWYSAGTFTVYENDIITTDYTNKGSTYTAWDFEWSDMACSAATLGGERTNAGIRVTNSGNVAANVYGMLTTDADWTYLGWIGAGGTYDWTGLSWNTDYKFHCGRTRYRTRTDYSTTVSNTGTLNPVSSNVTITFTGGSSDAQEEEWTWSNVPVVNTGSRTSYTITWKYMDSYNHYTTTTTSVYWNDSPVAPVTPSTQTSGNYRYVYTGWDATYAVYVARTITAQYTYQIYNCVNSGIGNTATTTYGGLGWDWRIPSATATWSRSNSYWSFNSNGSQSTVGPVTLDTAGATYQYNCDYIYVRVSGCTNATASTSTGWNVYNSSCAYTPNTNYAWNSSGDRSTKYSGNFTTANGQYSCPSTISYGYISITYNNCSASGNSSGWYTLNGGSRTFYATCTSAYSFSQDAGQQVTSTSFTTSACPTSVTFTAYTYNSSYNIVYSKGSGSYGSHSSGASSYSKSSSAQSLSLGTFSYSATNYAIKLTISVPSGLTVSGAGTVYNGYASWTPTLTIPANYTGAVTVTWTISRTYSPPVTSSS